MVPPTIAVVRNIFEDAVTTVLLTVAVPPTNVQRPDKSDPAVMASTVIPAKVGELVVLMLCGRDNVTAPVDALAIT